MHTSLHFKVECLEFGVLRNNDYRLTHNRQFHDDLLKEHKFVKWRRADVPKNQFVAAMILCPPKKARINEPSVELKVSLKYLFLHQYVSSLKTNYFNFY